jgi:hypothetical protein
MSEIAKWLGVWKEASKPKLLLEIADEYVDAIQDEIDEAESGTSAGMPFNDIFGTPTPENPRTRMVMPYGNPDIDKLKYILAKIRKDALSDYQKNPNVERVDYFIWDVVWQKATQDVRPLGWQEGDPLQKVEKDIGNLVLDVLWTSSKGTRAQRAEKIPLSTLLKKYMPNELDWWQGAKGQTGRYAFFTQNPELLGEITDDVDTNRDQYAESPPQNSNKIIIASRHPLDVLRMSDFKKTGITSCHTPGASHFSYCQQEVRDISGGGVLFSMDADTFNTVYPDGQIPQKGEIFDDSDRRVKELLPAPESRLRLRKVVDQDSDTEFAVPDKRIYPSYANPEFVEEAFKYFGEKQKDKFVDGEGNYVVPSALARFGGEYEDGGQNTVGNNFIKLMQTVYKSVGVGEQVNSDRNYQSLIRSLENNSIVWEGLPTEDDSRCDRLITAINQIDVSLDYMGWFANADCDNDPPYASIQTDVIVQIPIDELEDWFRGEMASGRTYTNSADFERSIRKNDFLKQTAGVSFTYPDLSLDDINIELTDDRQYFEARFSYSGLTTEVQEIEARYEDIKRFEDKVTKAQFTEAVRLTLQDMGAAKPAAYTEKKDQINEFANWVEQHESFSVDEPNQTSMEFKYSKVLAEEFISRLEGEKLQKDILTSMGREQINNDFIYEFINMFNKRAERYKQEIEKQMPLFKDIPAATPSDVKDISTHNFPTWKTDLRIPFDYKANLGSNNSSEDVEKLRFAKFIFDMTIVLDTSLSDELLEMHMRWIKEVVDDEDIILEIAYNTLQKVLAPGYGSLSEQKKKKATIEESKKLRKLLKEWYTRRGKQ